MAKGKGAGPKPQMPKTKSKGRTANPKLKGGNSQQVGIPGGSGMNVGGLTDSQVRLNTFTQGTNLHKQLKKNKSSGLKP
jgi:hypothetical protein